MLLGRTVPTLGGIGRVSLLGIHTTVNRANGSTGMCVAGSCCMPTRCCCACLPVSNISNLARCGHLPGGSLGPRVAARCRLNLDNAFFNGHLDFSITCCSHAAGGRVVSTALTPRANCASGAHGINGLRGGNVRTVIGFAPVHAGS